MPTIDNPSVATFCNTGVRPVANGLAGAVLRAQSFMAQWNAKGMAKLIPNTADSIDDGAALDGSSPPDGRTPITGEDVNGLAAGIVQIMEVLEANNNALLNNLFKIATNPNI